LTEKLSKGKFVFVDDLVTHKNYRSQGYGNKLIQWIFEFAKKNNCHSVELNSGVEKFDAHRFYLKNRMEILCHHFAFKINKNKKSNYLL